MSTAKCQIPVERVLQVRPKAMGIDVGHINDPQCGQGFHQEGAQELTAKAVIIANPAVLRFKEIECRRLCAEHVPVLPKSVDDATDFRGNSLACFHFFLLVFLTVWLTQKKRCASLVSWIKTINAFIISTL